MTIGLYSDARATPNDGWRADFDARFDIHVIAPAPTVGGPALHEFAPDEDPEMIADVALTTRSLPPASLELCRYAPVEPDRARRLLVLAAGARAAACGLDLRFTMVRFTTAPAHVPRGLAYLMFTDVCRVVIRADVPHGDLPRLLLHEFQHCHDFHAGLGRTMTPSELDHRAVVFSIRASDGWALPW